MKTVLWKEIAAALDVSSCRISSIGVAQAAPPILNVSTDLEQLPGVYKMTNMTQNTFQDSTPLLNDALRWVSHYNSGNPTTPYTTIKAERGVYYFLAIPEAGDGRPVYGVAHPQNK